MVERLIALYRNRGKYSESEQQELLAEGWSHANAEMGGVSECLLLLIQARLLIDAGKFEEALKLLARAEHLNNADLLAEVYRLRAIVFHMQGKREESFELLVKGYTSAEAHKSEWTLSQISLSLGVMSANSGDYD